MRSIGLYSVSGKALSVSSADDILQLRGAVTVNCLIHEIRLWQTSDTTLAMNSVRIRRGSSGATGTDLSADEDKYVVAGASQAASAFSLPGSNVGSPSFDLHCGWNILQEFVWLPTPEIRLALHGVDMLSVSLLNTATLTMGCSVTWEEFEV